MFKAVPGRFESGFPGVTNRQSLGGDSVCGGAPCPRLVHWIWRERVIEAVEGGASRREAAERFEVSASSAVQMASVVAAGRAPCAAGHVAAADRRWRTTRTGSSRWSASGRTGRSKSSSRPCTSRECRAAAARSGVFWSVTASASKKSLRAAEQQRADVARARRHWIRQQALLDSSSLVFNR